MTQPRIEPAADPASGLLSKPWYRNYVLGALALCYVVNVMDRSQVLSASIQSIRRSSVPATFSSGC